MHSVLVYNVTHSDLILGVSNAANSLSNGQAPPSSSSATPASPEQLLTKVTFARPKFSFYEILGRQVERRVRSEKILVGFTFEDEPITTAWNTLHLRGSNEPPPGTSEAVIVSAYIPLAAQMIPTWLRWFPLPAGSNKYILLICGTGRPLDRTACIFGNSTHATAQLIARFLRTYILEKEENMQINVIDSSAFDVFDYDQNVSFIRTNLMPQIDAIRREAAVSPTQEWRSRMEVTVALTEGSPARLGALSAALRAYKPWYAHLCQLKTFWHEKRLLSSDVRIYSFARVETTPPMIVANLSNDMHRAAVAELCRYRDEFQQIFSEQNHELHSFWLRKSYRPVLCVLVVAINDEGSRPTSPPGNGETNGLISPRRQTSSSSSFTFTRPRAVAPYHFQSFKGQKYIFYRGINLEVSQPTGSLCSERNAIGSALAANPSLNRRDVTLVAVLGMPKLAALANTEKSKPDTTAASSSSSSTSSQLSPDTKRQRTESIRAAFKLGEGADVNPLGPCGACNEWLKKIAEVNPDFKVMTFTDASCRECFVREVGD